jgi:hypothetical protein
MRSAVLLGLASMAVCFVATSGCSGKSNGDGFGNGSGGAGGSSHGGSGGSGGGGGSGGSSSAGGAFNCDYKEAGFEYCYSYTGLTAEQTTAEQDACSAYPASSTPSSCPSASQSGCCENVTEAGITFGYCLYNIPSESLSALASACNTEKGKWTGKAGGSGGSAGSGGSGGSGGEGGTGGIGGSGGSGGFGDDGGASEDAGDDGGGGSGGSGGSGGMTCAEVDNSVGCCSGGEVYYCNSAMSVVSETCAAGTVCGWNATKSY